MRVQSKSVFRQPCFYDGVDQMKFNSGKGARVEVATVCALATLCDCPDHPLTGSSPPDIHRLTVLAPLCIYVVLTS